jgi:hypothetical protein
VTFGAGHRAPSALVDWSVVLARVLLSLLVWGVACGGADDTGPVLERQALLDPDTCKACHPDQTREWSGSMHAYAADDPVFVAMNRRGQRETGGQLGDFCVKCHAPMAVAEGLTTDGMNLAQVPRPMKGVTCYFCHNAAAVTGTHNNPVQLANDRAMRGSMKDAQSTRAHDTAYSPLLDSSRTESAAMCGSCHDIVNPHGAHVERTFAEWNGSLFAKPPVGLSCAGCHMPTRMGLASTLSKKPRLLRSHTFAAVDVALTPFPEREEQRRLVQKELDGTLQATLCVEVGAGAQAVSVTLENVGAGHGWPSGAVADRRAWVEVIAEAKGEVVLQSGVVPEGSSLTKLDDPDLWLIRDCIYDEQGKETHDFWAARRWLSNQLAAPLSLDPKARIHERTHMRAVYPGGDRVMTLEKPIDRVRMRVRLRPVGDDVLEDLVRTGDLDPAVMAEMPTFDLGSTVLEWTPQKAKFVENRRGRTLTCVASAEPFVTGNDAQSFARCPPAPP